MLYKFCCPTCKYVTEIDIPMSEYDNQKNKQICPVCYAVDSNQVLLKRVIEWSGIASGNGSGWFGKSDGSKSI